MLCPEFFLFIFIWGIENPSLFKNFFLLGRALTSLLSGEILSWLLLCIWLEHLKSCDEQSHVPSPLAELLCGLGRQGSGEGAAWGCVWLGCLWQACPMQTMRGWECAFRRVTTPRSSFFFLLLPFFISHHIFSVSLPFSPLFLPFL